MEIFFIDKIPLTPNGKIDRASLLKKASEIKHCEESNSMVPMNESEKFLADIWKDIYSDDIRRDSNFFEIGGDSMKCIRVISRINNKSFDFSVQDFFENPTL